MYYFTNSPPNSTQRKDTQPGVPAEESCQPGVPAEVDPGSVSRTTRKRRRTTNTKYVSPEIPRQRESTIENSEVSTLDCDEYSADAKHIEDENTSVTDLPTKNSFDVLCDLPDESVGSNDGISLFDEDTDFPDTPQCSSEPLTEDPRTPEFQTGAENNSNRLCTLCDIERVSEWYHLRCRDCFKTHGPP